MIFVILFDRLKVYLILIHLLSINFQVLGFKYFFNIGYLTSESWRTQVVNLVLTLEDKETIKLGLITRDVIQWMTSVLMCVLYKSCHYSA